MWLLHTTLLKLQYFGDDDAPFYAALSHTWDAQEISFQDIQSGSFAHLPGYTKIKGTCDKIKVDYNWVWIDTCCIDKTSSAELSQAINSMYKLYEDSAACFVYLNDFLSPPGFNEEAFKKQTEIPGFKACKWFSRGWTLQELLAPSNVVFWDKNFNKIGTKLSFDYQISQITGIPVAVLIGQRLPQSCIVAQRLSWASERITTRPEDIAYCLLGLFNIHMVPIYGEGTFKAFQRLQEEILKTEYDHSLFVWNPRHDERNFGFLASSPRPFCRHAECLSWIVSDRVESDPYELLVPQDNSPLEIDSDGIGGVRTSLLVNHYTKSRSRPVPSLGPEGLQISLLVSDDISNVVNTEKTSLKDLLEMEPVICLDLQIRTYDHFGFNVLLPMGVDVNAGYQSHHISRRGLLCRLPITTFEGSSYKLDTHSRKFVRETVYISQREPTERSPVSVYFQIQRVPMTAKISGLFVDYEETMAVTQVQPPLGVVGELYRGYGGRIGLLHRQYEKGHLASGKICTTEDILFLVSFGVYGKKQTPWSAVSTGKAMNINWSEKNKPDPHTHRTIELHTSRYKSESYRQLPCGHMVFVKISPIVVHTRTRRKVVFGVYVSVCEYPLHNDIH